MRQHLLKNASHEELHFITQEWLFWARDKQLPPERDFRVWLLLAGRGFGKTRAGSEWVHQLARVKDRHIGLVGGSASDVRYVMVEGPSGILQTGHEEERPKWFSSKNQLIWPNGTIARCFSADAPGQLRGPEFHFAWADEVAKWRYSEAWDNLMLGLRKGDCPQILATTTPRPLGWLAELAKAPDTALVVGKTVENQANLAQGFIAAMRQAYGQSDLARQELDGELLADYPGALFSRAQLAAIVAKPPERAQFIRIVIGVDPAIGGANETGIIIAGKTIDNQLWILADHSLNAPPHIWSAKIRQYFQQWRAESVVVEINQGGDLVTHLLRQNGTPLPVRTVRAMKQKAARAEPIAAAYARGEIWHGGVFTELVDQMVSFCPSAPHNQPSPDRLDAAVWALHALMTGAQTQSHELRF